MTSSLSASAICDGLLPTAIVFNPQFSHTCAGRLSHGLYEKLEFVDFVEGFRQQQKQQKRRRVEDQRCGCLLEVEARIVAQLRTGSIGSPRCSSAACSRPTQRGKARSSIAPHAIHHLPIAPHIISWVSLQWYDSMKTNAEYPNNVRPPTRLGERGAAPAWHANASLAAARAAAERSDCNGGGLRG